MRIGPKMLAAKTLVAHNPGTAILPIARAIAPHGRGIRFGYRTVHRAIRAKLIRAEKSGNKYALYAN